MILKRNLTISKTARRVSALTDQAIFKMVRSHAVELEMSKASYAHVDVVDGTIEISTSYGIMQTTDDMTRAWVKKLGGQVASHSSKRNYPEGHFDA